VSVFGGLFDIGKATASATLTAPSGIATATRTISIVSVCGQLPARLAAVREAPRGRAGAGLKWGLESPLSAPGLCFRPGESKRLGEADPADLIRLRLRNEQGSRSRALAGRPCANGPARSTLLLPGAETPGLSLCAKVETPKMLSVSPPRPRRLVL
jgi:hypothetical protein